MTSNQEAFQNAMSKGHSAAWDQNWEQAVEYYYLALSKSPYDADALSSLALGYFELQRFNDSLEYYQRAARASPDNPLPLEKIAHILERQGNLPEAIIALSQSAELHLKNDEVEKSIACWIRVLSLQPDNLVARTRLAIVSEKLGRTAEAVSEYLAAASLMQNSGNPSEVMQIVEYCLKIFPDSPEARRIKDLLLEGQTLPRPSRPHGATSSLRMAGIQDLKPVNIQEKDLDPISAGRQNALVILASLLFDQVEKGENKEKSLAIPSLSSQTLDTTGRQSLNNNDPSLILHYLGQAIDAQTQGNDQKAAEELERALLSGLDHPAANYLIGFIGSKEQSQKALLHLQKAINHPDFALGSYLLMGEIHFQASRYTDALSAYLNALGNADSFLVPSDEVEGLRQLYETIIEFQIINKDENEQKKICESIQNQLVKPGWQQLLKTARGRLPIQSPGCPPYPLAEIFLETNISKIIEAMTHIRELASNNRILSAMEEAFHTIELAPSYLPLHILVAEILLQEGRVQEAITKFMLISDLYRLRGEHQPAVRMLMRIVHLTPMNLAIRSRLIDLLTAQGNLKEAIQQTINLAKILYQLLELDQARKTYASALRLAQQSNIDRSITVQILYSLVDIDLQKIDIRQALRLLEQIRTLEPEDLNARAQLVDLNFRLNQDNLAFSEIDNTVTTLENSGKISEAVGFLNNLIAERPEKLELHRLLADLHLRSGNVV
jgi:tetratricopeptide (TPR) repeat protein